MGVRTMLRHARRGALLALTLLLLPLLSGCDFAGFTIIIPDFDSSQVEGVTLWRVETGGAVEAYEVTLGPAYVVGGIEYVDYTVAASSTVLLDARAEVVRNAANPDEVTLSLMFYHATGDLQEYVVRTFNAHGDSAFSAESLTL